MVVVVIVWWLDLQLLVQSVPITTNVNSNPPRDENVLDTTLCEAGGLVVFSGYSGPPLIKLTVT